MAGQLSLFGGPRQRGRAVGPPIPEISLQFSVAKILADWAKPTWWHTHIPAEEPDARKAAENKRKGVTKGWADFVLIGPKPPFIHQLELKRRGNGRLTTEQKAMRDYCAYYGLPYEVAHSVDEAIAILSRWGAVRVRVTE